MSPKPQKNSVAKPRKVDPRVQTTQPDKGRASILKPPFDLDPRSELLLWAPHRQRFNQEASIRNEFNPKKLSFFIIDLKIKSALGPQNDVDRLLDHKLREMGDNFNAKLDVRRRPPTASLVGMPGVSVGLDMILLERSRILPTDAALLQKGDEDLADLIANAPFALLRSPEVQDALARWTYTARWHYAVGMRRIAKGYLDKCLQKNEGNPGKVPGINLTKLLKAYCELCRYIACIIAAAKAGIPKEKLRQLFSDCDILFPHDDFLEKLYSKRLMRPAPSAVAISYIAALRTLSIQGVKDLLSKARKSSKTARLPPK